jgi:antitoxin (DNA-binding transcriptional repressor) of toxin-antitoxin stability system
MRQVQLHEEEQQFAALVSEAEAGESLTILRQGKPVAQIIPFAHTQEQSVHLERQAAIQELDTLLETGIPLGGIPPSRDEMHDGR